MRRSRIAIFALLLAALITIFVLRRTAPPPAFAEIAVLTEENYDSLAPQGKEVDAIDGDYLMRNDRLVAVIGNPVPRRDANIKVQEVGGAVIDLTVWDRQSDQLGADRKSVV